MNSVKSVGLAEYNTVSKGTFCYSDYFPRIETQTLNKTGTECLHPHIEHR